MSMMGVVMPAMVPIMLPKPRFISIRKNITDQKGEAGKWVIASVKAMNARPVPCTDCTQPKEDGSVTFCRIHHYKNIYDGIPINTFPFVKPRFPKPNNQTVIKLF